MTILLLEFMRPVRLWALLAIPILLLTYALMVWRRSGGPRTPKSTLDAVLIRQASWKRHLAVVAAVLSVAALVVAWAIPRGYEEVPRERATVIVVIDVSRSMLAEDVKPTRLAAAQSAAKEFAEMMPKAFNVGLVAFAGTASLVVPPTTDRGAVTSAIDNLQLAPSTAIGEGIYTALDALALVPPDPDHPDDPAPAAIVLLSDGESNLGRSSATAAKAAKDRGVPVNTIAYGTATGYIIDRGQKNSVPVNHAELKRIADLSGGTKYSAESIEELRKVYEGIARSIGYEKVAVETTGRYVGIALLCGIVAALASIALGACWP